MSKFQLLDSDRRVCWLSISSIHSYALITTYGIFVLIFMLVHIPSQVFIIPSFYCGRLEHQLEHSEKSQSFLMEALTESPEDTDFKQAYAENYGAIERRRNSIRESKLLLQMVLNM